MAPNIGKRLHRFHDPGDLHELTFSCHARRPLLVTDDWRRRLSRCIDQAGQDHAIELVAFVYMPEHVHLLIYPTTPKPKIDHYLAKIKQPFSKQIKELLAVSNDPRLAELTVRERPGKHCFRFWQVGAGYDRNLNTPASILAAIDYIHTNPVRRGFCRRAIEWKWSGARYYCREHPSQDSDLPHIHGLPAGTLDEQLVR